MLNYKTYTPKEQEEIAAELEKFSAYPVFLEESTLSNSIYYYDSVISPIFHNFTSYKNSADLINTETFHAYKNMNRAFMAMVLKLYKLFPEAMVVFNDPYFLLTPKLIAEVEMPRMAYFFHCPFPSLEAFRVFPIGQEFMESLLCCDVVAFQLYEYARYFITCCHSLLGLEAESRQGGIIGIVYKGKDVIIKVGHTGINKDYTESLIKKEEFKIEIAKLIKLADKRRIIGGVDELSARSGIRNKLIAYRNLLEAHPDYQKKIVLIQYCTAGMRLKSTEETSAEIKSLVEEINNRFRNSIEYAEVNISNEKRLALFALSEILFITSLRDGFCLFPFEFLAAKDSRRKLDTLSKTSFGSIIISEFVGCASAMSSIRKINPYVISEITESLCEVIEAGPPVEDTIFKHDIQYIKKHDTEYWIKSLLADIKHGRNKNEASLYLGAENNKILKAEKFFKHLVAEALEKSYNKSANRVILLDAEGTIIPTRQHAIVQSFEAPQDLLSILETLCSDERNSVYIISGKSMAILDKWFGKIKRLGLVAEYGYHYRFNSKKEWKSLKVKGSDDWKLKAQKIFEWYKQKLDSPYIEVKSGSIVWNYKRCDPELGNWMAQELEKVLNDKLRQFPNVNVVHGKGFVETKLKSLEKGNCVRNIINHLKKKNREIDFVLTIGDDITDESMFKEANNLLPKKEAILKRMRTKDITVFTCTVGRKPTHANYYVNDYKETVKLLDAMTSCSIKLSRNKSVDGYDKLIGSRRIHSPIYVVSIYL